MLPGNSASDQVVLVDEPAADQPLVADAGGVEIEPLFGADLGGGLGGGARGRLAACGALVNRPSPRPWATTTSSRGLRLEILTAPARARRRHGAGHKIFLN